MENNEINCVLYTVVSGGYDNVNPISKDVAIKNGNIRFVLVTDDLNLSVDGWEMKYINNIYKTSAEFNRFYKIHPHLIFDEEVSIYIDGNIQVVGRVNELVNDFEISESIFSAYDHPSRKSPYDEAMICAWYGFGKFGDIKKQMLKYFIEGFSGDYLNEANVLIRKHKNPQLIKAMTKWWEEYMAGIKRDQLSLGYSCWEQNFKIVSLGKSDPRFEQKYFKYENHYSKRKRNFYLKLKNRFLIKVLRQTIL